MIIYKITNLENDKIYIGQTQRSLKERMAEHCRNICPCYIDRAIKKHGVENFKVEIVEECNNIDELNEREKFWISYFDCKFPNGYNLADGGKGSLGHSTPPDVLARLSRLRKGRKIPPEQRAKISATLKGKIFSEETRAKISAAKMGHTVSDETRAKLAAANFGKKASAETRAKMSASSKSKRKVRCIEINKEFSSMKEAFEWARISRHVLTCACRDKSYVAGGYHWEYADNI